jgi:hypothetical protein
VRNEEVRSEFTLGWVRDLEGFVFHVGLRSRFDGRRDGTVSGGERSRAAVSVRSAMCRATRSAFTI